MANKKTNNADNIELQREIHKAAAERYPHYQWQVADANGYMGFVEGAKWLLTKTEG